MALEYNSTDMESRYEVWNGVQVVKEPSSLPHEQVLGQLYLLLQNYVNQHGAGMVFLSNAAVYAHGGTGDFVMPDLTYVSKERKHLLKQNGVFGAPDLTVEIVSPGIRNTRRDTVDKFSLYERNGVKEYWLVDYIGLEVHMYGLIDGQYVPIEESAVLPGIELPIDTIFKNIDF